MSHKRNIDGLLKSAKEKANASEKRAGEAIRTLLKTGQPINFSTVAKAAQVSVAWLYRNEKMKQRIDHLRRQYRNQNKLQIPVVERLSDASKDSVIATLKLRIKELTDENQVMRRQLEVAYGQIATRTPSVK